MRVFVKEAVMELLIILGIIIGIIIGVIYLIVYALYYSGVAATMMVGAVASSYGKLLDGKGFAFLKDNLVDNENILIEGRFRISHILPSFSYFCIVSITYIILSVFIFSSALKHSFSIHTIPDKTFIFMSVIATCFLLTLLLSMIYRFINRKKSEFIVTNKRFAVRQFAFLRGSEVCRFCLEDFKSAELYQNVLDTILHNYTLRLSFNACDTEKNLTSVKSVDVMYIKNAKEIKKQIDSIVHGQKFSEHINKGEQL